MLKARRLAASLTQEALAERAGVSARAIADLERGVIRAPRRDTLDMLADALGLMEDERGDWHQLRRELSVRGSTGNATPSLPLPSNPLIGRDREVNALVNLITQPDNRLVTVTGAGGVGKTRIALAVGHELMHTFPDGVEFVALASIRNADLLVPTVAQHLGIRDGDPEALRNRLITFLARRNMLLILDNAEHLRTSAADLASLLANTSTLHMLVTSRAGLRISAEHEFPVSPLRLPDWDSSPVTGNLQTYPAIQLFLQRAQQIRPEFTLTEKNSADIARICYQLDGLPLAIELAAARVRVLSPEQILVRLSNRLSFLTEGFEDAPDRHRTIRAAISWSYDLLSEPDKSFFRRLSVCVGGWTLEAAEALALDPADAIEGLTRLVNDHLITESWDEAGQVRFSMLETVREFGLHQLHALGEHDIASEAHAEYFLSFIERAEPELRGPDQVAWLRRVDGEVANLRRALEWAHQSGVDPDFGLRMVAALTWFWETRGHISEGRAWFARSLERDAGTPEVRMKALVGAGWMAHIQQDSVAARRTLLEGLDLARSGDDRWWESWILHLMGRVAYFDGDAASAFQYGEESLQIARELDDRWIIAWDEHLFGLAAFIEGDLKAARSHYQTSLTIREDIGYPEGIGLVNGLLGIVNLQEGDQRGAFQQFRKGLESGHTIGARWLIINWIANIVLIAADAGESDLAARLAGFVESMSDITGAIPIPITDVSLRKGIQIAREQLGDDVYQERYATGQRMMVDEAIQEALSLDEKSVR